MKEPKKKLMFTAAYIALVLLVIKPVQIWVRPMFANRFASRLVTQALFAALAVAGAVLFGKADGLKLRSRGFREGMLSGLGFWIVFPLLLVLSLIVGHIAVTEPAGNIVLFVAEMLLIGVTEEVLFRNLLQNAALEVTGEDSVDNARKGILLAGLVFGLVHLTNIFAGVTVVGAAVQAVMAIPMGVVLGVIYFRSCNNLLPVILIHALVDGVSFATSGGLSGTTMADAITGVSMNGGPVGKGAAFLFYTALALFLMRKSKMEKAIDARHGISNRQGEEKESESREATQKASWLKVLGCTLVWYLLVFVLLLLGEGILGALIAGKLVKPMFPAGPALETALLYLPFVGCWVTIPLYIWLHKKDRPIFKALGKQARGNNWKLFLLGLLLGFGMNGFCALAAWLNHDIALHFDSFRPISFLPVFLSVFIQASAEELWCRGFLYQKYMKLTGKPIAAIVGNSLFFALMHLTNDHVTALSLANIICVGVFYSLMVYYTDSIWFPMAHHAAWNFTQNILLGLPNSGFVVPYSVFKIDSAAATSSLVYDAGFGIEGSLLAALVFAAGCVLLTLWGRKQGRKPINVWEEA